MNYPAVKMTEAELLSRIIYRDALILVLNKPHGLPVHAAGPKLHNLEQYFELLRFGLPKPPHLAHRLDRDTSGCLVLARNPHAARRMHELFTAGAIKKTYLAVVHGRVKNDSGSIDIPLSKQSKDTSNWRMKPDSNGTMTALTDYQVVSREDDRTMLKLTPHTGRTHQLRVHCLALGNPIVGDVIYGPANPNKLPLHLHAHSIEIPFYDKKPSITVTAPLPDHMVGLFN